MNCIVNVVYIVHFFCDFLFYDPKKVAVETLIFNCILNVCVFYESVLILYLLIIFLFPERAAILKSLV